MDTVQQLAAAIEQAFAGGHTAQGLQLLRRYNDSPAGNAQSFNRQAVIEEQVGDWRLAGRCHHRCIGVAPQVAAGYLYAGYWLQQSGQTDAAAACYSLAQEADPGILQTSDTDLEQSPGDLRASAANKLLRSTLSQQHRALFDGQPDCTRIANAIWVQTHDAAIKFSPEMFKPDLFCIDELPKHGWYESGEFDWSADLLAARQEIQAELIAALDNPLTAAVQRPYLPVHFSGPSEMRPLAGSSDWTAIDLYRDGIANQTVLPLFKRTVECLQKVPTYGLDATPFEAFFSVLAPGQEIVPHYGQSNHSLTVHLPMVIPDDCYLQVGDEKREWQEDDLLIFDDSFLHSAHNNSEQQRIVLIFSVWNPALNDAEQVGVQRCFNARRDWLEARRGKLGQLLEPHTKRKP